MTGYIKHPYTGIFTRPTGCGKSHLFLDLTEKEYRRHFDYIIIICPMLRWNKTYHAKAWIRHNEKVWLIEPKDMLYPMSIKVVSIVTMPRNTIYH